MDLKNWAEIANALSAQCPALWRAQRKGAWSYFPFRSHYLIDGAPGGRQPDAKSAWPSLG
eukprot:5503283-Amphidinium_carterae.2